MTSSPKKSSRKLTRRPSGDYDPHAIPRGFRTLWKAARDIRWIVTGACAIAVLAYRNSFMVTLGVGAIMNAGISKVLKYTIRQSRPAGTKKQDPGMPSSHAAGLFFFATFLSWAVWQQDKTAFGASTSSVMWMVALMGAALFATGYRVVVRHHTLAQVTAGTVLGVVDATLCFHYVLPHMGFVDVWIADNIEPYIFW
eukprot:comp23144_c1_seq1/m.37365 comp23144_c1_seq1/g.37365  ORF comp23144_c1_seq1/g.37365 comp23144_c1_seq1/m.37365 type:complete len:197 (-) comp23144_c1_seq1:136-726(-)